MPIAAPLSIAPDDLAELRRWARSRLLPAVLVQRARILLLAADEVPGKQIAAIVGSADVSAYDLTCRSAYDLTCRSSGEFTPSPIGW